MILAGSAILAFGLYNVHSLSDVTEGGVLGLTLLLHHHFGISPSVSGLVMNFLCYALGFFVLGKSFILYSAIAGAGFSAFYAIFEKFPPVCPQIADHPLVAALIGAVFVGIGVGISIKYGGDIIVLALSLTYIEVHKIGYSLITVIISGQLIGVVQNFEFK